MEGRLNELLDRLESASEEFAELVSEVREISDTMDAYRLVFRRKVAPDREMIEALKLWQPKIHQLIMEDIAWDNCQKNRIKPDGTNRKEF